MSVRDVALGLAAAFLASDWSEADMLEHARLALGARRRWVRGLVGRVRAQVPAPPHHDPEALVALLAGDETLREKAPRHRVRRLFLSPAAMRPGRRFDVPELPREAALAAWLGLSVEDLAWFADPGGWLARAPDGPLQHYRLRWIPKRDGTSRLLEAPKEGLKAVQRRLLRDLLSRVPPHDAAHGFRAGRSVLSFVAPHCGKAVVLRLDLRDFFPSVGAGRVHALLRALGYPRRVATVLTGLMTTRTPAEALDASGLSYASTLRFRNRHLAQGAPTSPALANLAAFWLDARLQSAARAAGADYTRYADDLAFSGDRAFAAQVPRFRDLVLRIAAEEGFELHPRKDRVMGRAARQRLAGLVVNERPAPPRAEFDRLKAILHNCARAGPAAQNRAGVADFRAHLRGRVAWFEHAHPARGAKLKAMFDRIAW